MSIDIEVIATAASILAEEALVISLLDRTLQLKSLIPELASDVNVRGLGAHGETNEKRTLDELVRIVSKDFSVLAGAGLRLISVDDQIGGSTE